MSYCRWSTDNFKCDLYCYANVSGEYTTHVAGNRYVGEVPVSASLEALVEGWGALSEEQQTERAREYTATRKLITAFLETCERKPIELPHAGETFNDDTLEDFKARLLYLRGLGYQFPDEVLVEIDEEIAEQSKEPT